jgi:tetratricopeptide (TPR) repeat protein
MTLGVCLVMLGAGCAHAPEKPPEPAPPQVESKPEPTPQQTASADELSDQGYKAYAAMDFPTCAERYRQAAEASKDDTSRADAFYGAACCATLAGDTAQGLELVKRAVQSGYYDVDYLQVEPELLALHSLPGWQEVLSGARANLAKAPHPPRPVPVLAAVDVYGSRRADAEAVRRALGYETGKPFVASGAQFRQKEEALRKQYNLAFAKLSFISYFAGPEANRAYITVDLVDAEDAARLQFLPTPSGHPEDPEGLVAHWQAYEKKGWQLFQQGQLDMMAKDRCKVAHCIMGFIHPDLAPYEPVFLEKVPQAREALVKVLREEENDQKRAAAAFVLAYAGTPEQVVDALVPFIRDPSHLVRNNVLRVIMATQQGADRPLLEVAVVVNALSMPETTDRNKALYLLKALLEKLPPESLKAQRPVLLRQLGFQLMTLAGLQQPNNRDPARDILQLLTGKRFESAKQ